ncbi:MAG: NTP transferase domain-containing protein [Endomicrobiia bacterium]
MKKTQSIGIILAAGKGTRIKSETPKVLHPIWGIPSVLRVCNAVRKGLKCEKLVVVVGKKAKEVINLLNKKSKDIIFAYQKVQKGTGHAVQTALNNPIFRKFNGNIFVFPGDAGLIDEKTVREFKNKFERSNCDLMILSGKYEGNPEDNPYGRIVRINDKVIGIPQAKDILKMSPDDHYGPFSRQQLLEISEFDSGMFAFKSEKLKKYIRKLKPKNVQKELYITDLVEIYNKNGLKVGAFQSSNSDVLLGFNSRSDLKKMEAILRKRYFEMLKDIITIEDEENFYIDSEVIEDIIKMDKKGITVDITLGEGCSISKGVKLSPGIKIGKNSIIDGNVILGKKVNIHENVRISTYPEQKLFIGDNSEIFGGNIIKGNVRIGKNTKIESGVRITGSDKYPTHIGNNCIIKGTTYIFGSTIEDNTKIQHSVLVNQYVKSGVVKYILPKCEGTNLIIPI